MQCRLTSLLLGLAPVSLACTDAARLTSPALSKPRFTIADAAHGFGAGFYWLPPLVKAPAFSGTFDGSLSPTVQICELAGAACGRLLATFTMASGPGSETIRVDAGGQHYRVNWNTRESDLSAGSQYRISVNASVNGPMLGFADVLAVANGKARKDTDAELGAVVVGQTLPIKFRIETGWTVAADVMALDAGEDFSCALTRTGKAYCWGWGLFGQLGTGATTNQPVPTSVAESPAFRAVSAGATHTCALTGDGQAYCWGRNRAGELGTGTTERRLTPAPVAGGLAFASISAGGSHTCALSTEGKAYCWGSGMFGELGNGSFDDRWTPTLVGSGHSFTSITTGTDHTCAIATNREAYCWGAGGMGELGSLAAAGRLMPTPTPVDGNLRFSSISGGNAYTCGIAVTGQAYCWGWGSDGRLGTGAMTNAPTPTAIASGLKFSGLSAGFLHTCGVTTGRQAYCWGSGLLGQMGDGSGSSRLTPVAVAGGHSFASVTVGAYHSCGVTTGGMVYCWGHNSHGQLGIGEPIGTDQRTPVLIAPLDE